MLSRGPDVEIEPYYCLPVGTMQGQSGGPAGNVTWSQPTSPTPPSRFSGPLSPTHPNHRLTYPKKNDDGMTLYYLYFSSFFHCSSWSKQHNYNNHDNIDGIARHHFILELTSLMQLHLGSTKPRRATANYFIIIMIIIRCYSLFEINLKISKN